MPTTSPKTVAVDGGLVTSREASTLAPGEMTRTDNCEYKPNSPSLWKVPGRTRFNASAEAARISGLAYLEFDVAADILVSEVGTALRFAAVGATGSWADLETGLTGGGKLIARQYRNEWYLCNGVDDARMVRSNIWDWDGVNEPPAENTEIVKVYHGVRFPLLPANAPIVTVLDGAAAAGAGWDLAAGEKVDFWLSETLIFNAEDLTTARKIHSPPSARVTITGPYTDAHVTIDCPWPPANEASRPPRSAGKVGPAGLPQQGSLQVSVFWSSDKAPGIGAEQFHTRYPIGGANGGFSPNYNNDDWTTGPITYTTPVTGDATFYDETGGWPTVAITYAGSTQQVSKYETRPVPSTMDVFEDSMMMNDINDPSIVWYSFPDVFEAIPAFNFIRLDTDRDDAIQLIRTVGDISVVASLGCFWSVKYLPRPEDVEVDFGRVKKKLSNHFGCVNPRAGALFDWGGGERLAMVSRSGIIVTDGFSWDILTDDIDWENTVEQSLLSNCVLHNDPFLYRLIFLYTPKDGTTPTKGLFINYHPSHTKRTEYGVKAKISGPYDITADCLALATLAGADRIFSGQSDGRVYLEREGNSDTSTATGAISMVARTGVNYFAERGMQAAIEKLYASHGAHAGQKATAELYKHNAGRAAVREERQNLKLDIAGLQSMGLDGMAGGHQFGLLNADALGQVRLDYFALTGKGWGEGREG